MKFMGFTFTAALFMLCVWEGAEGCFLSKKMFKFMRKLNPQCSMGLQDEQEYMNEMQFFSDNFGMDRGPPALFQFIEAGIKLSKTWHSKKFDTIDEAEVYSVMINVMHDHSEMVQAYNHECMNQYICLYKDEVNGFLNKYLEANHQYLIQLCRRVKHPIDKHPEFPAKGNYDQTFIDAVAVKKNTVLEPVLKPMTCFLRTFTKLYNDTISVKEASDKKHLLEDQASRKGKRLSKFLLLITKELNRYPLNGQLTFSLGYNEHKNTYSPEQFRKNDGYFNVTAQQTRFKQLPEGCVRKEARKQCAIITNFIHRIIRYKFLEKKRLRAEHEENPDSILHYSGEQQQMKREVQKILDNVKKDQCPLNESDFFQIHDTKTVAELRQQIESCKALLNSLEEELTEKLSE